MSDAYPSPPRWATTLLDLLVRPTESESIPGDLLEEYREAARPSLGKRRADAWYARHVCSVLWQQAWPYAAVIAALRIVLFPLPGPWNPSIVAAPGLSLLDAIVFASAGYFNARRTGRVSTGLVVSTVVSIVGFALLMTYAALTTPGLIRAPFSQPFIFIILLVLSTFAVAFSWVFAFVGGLIGRNASRTVHPGRA
jgi:hypothetical protein